MSYIFVDRDGQGGQSQMRSQMREEMRRRRSGGGYYRNNSGMMSYEDGYCEGYKHGFEDCEAEKDEEFRSGRGGSGRYL